jgi:Patatin-like phospholipase
MCDIKATDVYFFLISIQSSWLAIQRGDLRRDPPFKIEPQKELVFLALSGGGADGAFDTGILNGWTETKQRPEFTIVSGVSTGAHMAPFAFLGPAYDGVIKEIYTGGYAEQFVKAAHVSNVMFGAGLISAGSANRKHSEKRSPPAIRINS